MNTKNLQLHALLTLLYLIEQMNSAASNQPPSE